MLLCYVLILILLVIYISVCKKQTDQFCSSGCYQLGSYDPGTFGYSDSIIRHP